MFRAKMHKNSNEKERSSLELCHKNMRVMTDVLTAFVIEARLDKYKFSYIDVFSLLAQYNMSAQKLYF